MSVTPFYIYRHIRPDTNEVFYIGKGNNLSEHHYNFRRKNVVSKRNKIWNNIVDKNKGVFASEILFECETEQQVNEKEVEFISLYGRKDLGTGTLANLTDGGDGCMGMRHNDVVRKRMSESRKGEKNYLSKKIINVNTKEVYVNIPLLSEKCGIGKWALYKLISGKRPNYTPYVFYDDYIGNGIDWAISNSNMGKPKVVLSNWEKVINTETGVIYDNKKEAAKSIGVSTGQLLRQLRGYYISRGKKLPCINNTKLKIYDGVSL